GRWWQGPPRVPVESSDFTATACAIRTLKASTSASREDVAAESLRKARQWLERTKPSSTEDKTFRLYGLKWAEASRDAIDAAVEDLKHAQNADGGWGQMPGFNSDAYATGQALVMLHDCGGVDGSDRGYRRGIRYLLNTQEPDGSWFVHKRAVAFNG